jgi:predicted nucleic acid-binding protein
VLPFDVAVARRFSEIRSSPELASDLTTRELQVAATALHHGLELVTSRPRRFRSVTGLSVRPLPGTRSSA